MPGFFGRAIPLFILFLDASLKLFKTLLASTACLWPLQRFPWASAKRRVLLRGRSVDFSKSGVADCVGVDLVNFAKLAF